jgi:hypothetical protein
MQFKVPFQKSKNHIVAFTRKRVHKFVHHNVQILFILPILRLVTLSWTSWRESWSGKVDTRTLSLRWSRNNQSMR